MRKLEENQEISIDRRRDSDRRTISSVEFNASPNQSSSRRKKTRRRQIDPTTCEREYNNCEIEFMQAIDTYKRSSGRMFPTCSEILEVIKSLGYERLTPEEALMLKSVRELETASEDCPESVSQDGEVSSIESTVSIS